MKNGKLQIFKQQFKLPELLGITGEAEELRNQLALAAVAVKAVTNPKEQDTAMAAAQDIQGYVKDVQRAGLEFRRPITAFTSLIKKTEDDHLAPLLVEKDRVERVVLGFQQQERRRVEAEEEAQRKAYQIAEAARIELERKAREAEAAAAASGKRRDAKEAERLAEQAAAAEAAIQTQLRTPPPEVSRATGATIKQVLRHEVIDAATVFKHRPELCKVEVKASAVNAVCIAKVGATELNKDETSVPGLCLWWADDLSTRRRMA